MGFGTGGMKGKWPQAILRMGMEAAIAWAVSLFYYHWVHAYNTTVALTYLLLVLAAATVWGLPEALFASVCSILFFDLYFLAPVHSIRIYDPQNWIDFGAFLITSLVASDLSTRSKK